MYRRIKRGLIGVAAGAILAGAAVPLANSGEFVRPASFADGTITKISNMAGTVDIDGVTYVVGGGADIDDMRPGDRVNIAYIMRDGERFAITILPEHRSGNDDPE